MTHERTKSFLLFSIDAIMAEELKVVLNRSEDSSFGFSLLGTSGLPHVIYDIIENSPAAECGVVRIRPTQHYFRFN